MFEYVCTDGPLAGQGLEWADGTTPGQLLTVALVDVGQPEVAPDDEPEADYRLERPAEPGRPGQLRFVTGRGPWREPAGAAALPEA